MNKIYTKSLILLFSLLFALSSCQYDKNLRSSLEKDNMHGRVRSVKQTGYKAIEKDGKIIKGDICNDGCLNVLIAYDTEGRRVSTKSFYSDGSLELEYSYKFNKYNNPIESHSYTADGERSWYYTYEYDRYENIIEATSYSPDGKEVEKYIYQYNSKGDQTEAKTFTSDGSDNLTYTYDYDEKGRKRKVNWYYSEGSLDKKGSSVYDTMCYLVMTKRYDKKGCLEEVWQYEYAYDSLYNWTRQTSFLKTNNDSISKAKYVVERKIEYHI